MNELSILGGPLLCTGLTEKKGVMMRGSKDDSSMTRYRFMEAAVTPMCGNNGRSVTSIFTRILKYCEALVCFIPQW